MHEYLDNMIDVFTKISDKKEMKDLFKDIFTESEIHDLSLRWGLLDKLSEGMPQREISSSLGVSLCKITRGAKILKNKESELYKIFNKKENENG